MGERLGAFKIVTGSDPAANTEISQVVTAGKFWELRSFSVSLAQGIVQTPLPILQIDDGTSTVGTVVLYEFPGSTTVQAISTTTRYTWAAGFAAITGQLGLTTAVRSVAALPSGLILSPGWRINTLTVGIGGNSDYGAPKITVVEFDTDPTGWVG